MSVEPEPGKVATARRLIELYGSGDHDGAVALVDEDVVLVPAGGQSPIHGRAALRKWMEPETLAQPTLEILDFESASDKVSLYIRGRFRGIKSGFETDFVGWTVVTVAANGLITRIELFLGHEEAEARTAAGLRRP